MFAKSDLKLTSIMKSTPTPVWMILIVLFLCISVCNAISCFECSSVNDNFCPETMSDDDDTIVPYNDCKEIHEAQHCVKTTGVIGGIRGNELFCFVCDETQNGDFGCSDPAFLGPLTSCRDVFDAQYCIKATGILGGSLGTRRFCSSRDMGNYCEYIKRPGDQLEYRSCVYTCNGTGCNSNPSLSSNSPSLQLILAISVLSLISSQNWNFLNNFLNHRN